MCMQRTLSILTAQLAARRPCRQLAQSAVATALLWDGATPLAMTRSRVKSLRSNIMMVSGRITRPQCGQEHSRVVAQSQSEQHGATGTSTESAHDAVKPATPERIYYEQLLARETARRVSCQFLQSFRIQFNFLSTCVHCTTFCFFGRAHVSGPLDIACECISMLHFNIMRLRESLLMMHNQHHAMAR